ncbi:class I SAM-dependent methyltransferase [Chitinophaga varians]|uniref:class I SAM-dependent methyltransferase n=1 Tax=Chitinophaga varians TaxID=2202339 RepID=UPI00165FE86B|nr:class I SAM-dependent methyltransferase [Chitinophaga varians]MBC9915362.1 class I SAM-dependent methyltransferase [Chitinophaga varians]
MKENKYDDPGFFENYSRMPRSVEGLNAAGEWEVFRNLLPPLQNKRVLDLGCGFGWHCRYVMEQQAASVIGMDLSEKMLEQARLRNGGPGITYLREAMEDIDFPPGSFDVVLSSLALHYSEHYDLICRKIFDCLSAGGHFVFSTEHPVFTAIAAQDWYLDAAGQRLHWPVDHYQDQGRRTTRFLDTDVVKYHRTVATLINGLLDAGFMITRVEEPKPSPAVLEKYPEMKDETRRPIFILIAAQKPSTV